MTRHSIALVFMAGVCASPAAAQSTPSPAEVLGYELGTRFTTVPEAHAYARALAESSDRVRVLPYGRSAGGRELILLVLGSERNLAGLEEILADNRRLTDPALPASRAAEIARSNPAIVWYTYGQHGDEAASTEAALWTAWELAAGQSEASVVLDSLVVVIDPVANPDGRDRYVGWYADVRGSTPNPEPATVEHHPPWPGGRYNHDLFDLNRDWAWATQPETRDRLVEWARWNPQVHVDFHEMEYESSYFFFPAAAPTNPLYPDYIFRWAEYFGSRNAAEFDRRQWMYYSGERFDLYYPGYGDTWPSLVGAIGMTFEQAGGGRAGLAVRRSDGTILTLRDRATRHRVAGLTTLQAASARKTELLQEFAAFHREAGRGMADILLVPGPDPRAATELVGLLQAQGIRVEQAVRPFRAEAVPHPGFDPREEFPVGTYRVPARQARGRLAMTLLLPEDPLERGAGWTFDVTTWSLPYLFGVEAHAASGVTARFTAAPVVGIASDSVRVPEAAYGYLVPPGFESAGAVYRYLAAGGRGFALEKPFLAAGREWPPGTIFLPADAGASDRLEAAGASRLAVPVASGRTPSGVEMGSARSLTLRASRIGVFRGDGVRPTSMGAVWFLLEQLAGIPFDALDASAAGREDLHPYDVLVVPEASPKRAFTDSGRKAVEEWVRAGGTLVTLGAASRWAAEIAEIKLRAAEQPERPEEQRRRRALRTLEERLSDARRERVKGFIVAAGVDSAHPLAWGTGLANEAGAVFLFHVQDLVFEPDERFTTVIAIPDAVQVLSGTAAPEKVEELRGSSWLLTDEVGKGRIVAFADDPLFRLMWRPGFTLFANALLLAPELR